MASKDEAAALRAQLLAAKVAATEAKAAQDALAAAAKLAAVQQAAAARVAAESLKAQAKAANDAAKAQVAGMAAVNRILNEKHVADAKSEALAARTKKDQAAAALATQRVADAQAKAAARAKEHGTTAQQAMGAASNASAAHDKILSKKKALLNALGGDFATLANAVEQTGGPLGDMASKFKSVVSIFEQAGQAGPIGVIVVVLAMVVAGLALVAAAATAAAVAMTRFALACADAARSQRLLDNAAAGSVARGSELNKIVSDIASRVPIAREAVAQFGRQLELAGISGRRMQIALEAIAMIESAVPGAGAKIEELVERFQRLKRAVLTKADLQGTGLALVDVAAQLAKSMNITTQQALAMLQNGTAGTDKVLEAMRKAIEQKFGKTIAAQLMSLDVQFAKLRENIAALFSGLDLEPVLAAIKSVTDLFSQNTVTGRVLKELMSMIFQPIFDAIAKVAPLARSFLLGFAVGLLRAYIVIKPFARALAEAFGQVDKGKAMATVFRIGTIVAYAFGAALYAVIFVIMKVMQVANALGAAWDWISSVASKIMLIPAALSALFGMGQSAGGGLIDGIVAGVQAKIGAAIAAVQGLGEAIEGALRNAIGWHSPATLGVDAIGAIGAGFDKGQPAASDKASAAVSGLVSPGAAKSAAKGARASGGARIIYIEVHPGAENIAQEIRKALRIEGETEFVGAGG